MSNKCNQCGCEFSRKDNLKSHLKIHTGEKSNKCSQCDYASSNASSLRTHLKTHSGEKPNKCNQCDYACSQAGSLRRHEQLQKLERYFAVNKLSLNVRKTRSIAFLPPKTHFHYHDLILEGQAIQWCCSPGATEDSFRFLGVLLDDKLTFQHHIKKLYGKLCSASYAVASSAKVLSMQTAINVYRSLYESNLMYCASTWGATKNKFQKLILGHQIKVLKNLFGLPRASHISPLLHKHRLLKTADLINREQVMVVHNSRMKNLPGPISNIVRPLQPAQVEYRVTRNSSHDMELPQVLHNQYIHHPPPRLVIAWNRLPEALCKILEMCYLNTIFTHTVSSVKRLTALHALVGRNCRGEYLFQQVFITCTGLGTNM